MQQLRITHYELRIKLIHRFVDLALYHKLNALNGFVRALIHKLHFIIGEA